MGKEGNIRDEIKKLLYKGGVLLRCGKKRALSVIVGYKECPSCNGELKKPSRI
jgi:hypothetical protein